MPYPRHQLHKRASYVSIVQMQLSRLTRQLLSINKCRSSFSMD